MNKSGFKIGDKVKLKQPRSWNIGDAIGEVIGFDRFYIRVDWEGAGTYQKNYPHLSREIEHAVKVGQQLLFNFMQEN